MRAASSLSPFLQGSSLPFLPLLLGLSTLYSSATPPGHLSCHLCICVSLKACRPPHWKLKEDSRHLPGQLEELAFCLAQPSHLSGTYLNVLDRTLPFPELLGPFQPALWWQPPQSLWA